MFAIEFGTCIVVNLILNGRTEFILTPRFCSIISVFGKETLSIDLVKTGVLLVIVTVAISL
jgi:hypothetical protein